MFLSIINDLGAEWQESLSVFKYYLERHIEVDGDHHSHLAMSMTEELLGNDSEKSRYFKKLNFFSYALAILYILMNFFLIKRLIVSRD
jgi:hypothetical protein